MFGYFLELRPERPRRVGTQSLQVINFAFAFVCKVPLITATNPGEARPNKQPSPADPSRPSHISPFFYTTVHAFRFRSLEPKSGCAFVVTTTHMVRALGAFGTSCGCRNDSDNEVAMSRLVSARKCSSPILVHDTPRIENFIKTCGHSQCQKHPQCKNYP